MDIFMGAVGAYAGLGAAGMAVVGLALAAAVVSAFLEKGLVSFLALCAFGAGVGYFGHVNPVAALAAHPLLALGAFGGYFMLGAVWSISRFWLYSNALARQFAEFKEAHLRAAGAKDLDSLGAAGLAAFKGQATFHMGRLSRSGQYPATPASHKADILFWMGWWPVSIASYVLDEPVRRLMEAIYRSLMGVYVGIAKEQGAEYAAAMGTAE